MREAWNNVEALLNELRPVLLESGVPERQLNMPVGREPHEIKLEIYVEAFDWLHRLGQSAEIAAVDSAKKLIPQSQWDKYKAYGFRGLQEQLILERAQERLRKAWRTHRPGFFGKTYEPKQDGDQQDSSSQQLRSPETRPNESDC